MTALSNCSFIKFAPLQAALPLLLLLSRVSLSRQLSRSLFLQVSLPPSANSSLSQLSALSLLGVYSLFLSLSALSLSPMGNEKGGRSAGERDRREGTGRGMRRGRGDVIALIRKRQSTLRWDKGHGQKGVSLISPCALSAPTWRLCGANVLITLHTYTAKKVVCLH